jgi:Putative zinc-finger
VSCDDSKILMMKKVDGRIDPEEEAALAAHVEGCDECRAELADFTEHKQVTDMIRERLQYDAALDGYWKGVHNRLERGIGLGLFVVGIGIMGGFGLYAALSDPALSIWLRVGIGAMAGGALILLISVIRWRITTGKKDKYTEVIR